MLLERTIKMKKKQQKKNILYLYFIVYIKKIVKIQYDEVLEILRKLDLHGKHIKLLQSVLSSNGFYANREELNGY